MKAALKIVSFVLLKWVAICLLFSIFLVYYTPNSSLIFLAEVPLEMPPNYQHINDFEELTEDIEVNYLIDLAVYLNPSEKYQIKDLLYKPTRLSDLEIPTPPPKHNCI